MLTPVILTRNTPYPQRTALPTFAGRASVRFGADEPQPPANGGKSGDQVTLSSTASQPKADVNSAADVKPAAPVAPASTPEATPQDPKAPEQPQGWSLFGLAKTAAMFVLGSIGIPVLMAFAPLTWTLGAGVALSIALPILASRVKPEFAAGKLVNEASVIKTAGKELKRLLKVVAAPVMMVPNLAIKAVTWPFTWPLLNRLGVPTNKHQILKLLLQGKKFLAKNIPLMFSHPRLQTFAMGFPTTTFGKLKFGVTCVGLVMLIAFKSRLAKIPVIGPAALWLLNWLVPSEMVNNVKSFATEIGKTPPKA